MVTKATAVDIGSHSAKILVAQAGKHGVKVLRFAGLPRGEGDGAISLAAGGIPLAGACCGLAGRDMTLRYSQVPPTPDWQLRNLMDLEIQDLAQQSGGALSADYNLLPPVDAEAGVDTVLLALAKDEALDRLQGELKTGGGSAAGFVPNCIALYNAFLKCGPVEADAVVCLVNIGHQTTDLCIVRGTDLLFARNLTSGLKVLDDAIAGSFNVGGRKAEALKKDLLDLDPQSRGRYASGQAEKVTLAATAAAGSIPAAIQSSLSFCKAQTKLADLRLDKVLVAGGGARLRGVRGLLREALRCPVELFDPFANLDLGGLPQEDLEQLEAMRHEAVVALGLAVGRLDGTLYSLEILPDAVKRRQRFQQRTIFNVLAAVVVAAVLLLQQRFLAQSVDAADGAALQMRGQINRATAINNQAADLIEKNKVDRALVDFLAQQALPQQGLLAVLRAIGAHLEPQLWIEKLELTGVGAVVGRGKPPAVEFDAAGKEINGVQVGDIAVQFVKKLGDDPGLKGLSPPVMKNQAPINGAPSFRVTVGLEGGQQLMDIGAFVQENKRWLIGCLIGAVVWFLGAQILASLFVPVRPSSKGAPTSAYDQAALDLARQEQAALVAERARLQQELAFVPSARFQLAGKGAADQYLFQLGRELKQTVLGFANDRDVAVTDQSLVWDSPTGVDEIRGQLFAMELLDEVQQRLFQAHDRVRAANPEAKGLRAITLLKLEPRRAPRGMARSLRPGEVAVGDHVVQERVTFQFQADEATIADFVEALRQPGRTLLVEAFQLVKPTRVGETCTVKGALQGIAFKD